MKKQSDAQNKSAAKADLESFPKRCPEWLDAYNTLKSSRGDETWQKIEVADFTISVVEKMSPGLGIQRLYEKFKKLFVD